MHKNHRPQPGPLKPDDPHALHQIQEALSSMQYGKLTVVVQDGRIIQLERTDKVRLPTSDHA